MGDFADYIVVQPDEKVFTMDEVKIGKGLGDRFRPAIFLQKKNIKMGEIMNYIS